MAQGSHLHTKVVRMLVIKAVVKGSILGLVASLTFLENTVLFTGGGVLRAAKVGKGRCGPDRVPFRRPKFTNDPFFI